MKRLGSLLNFALLAIFFVNPATLCGEDKRELLPENTPWSFVNTRPGLHWKTQHPLPGGQTCTGEIRGGDQWPKDAPFVWMTAKLTLPGDYTPGNLYLRYRFDDNLTVFINGTPVYEGIGYTSTGGRTRTHTRRIENILVPGENIIAVLGENTLGDAFAFVSLLTDIHPPLDLKTILPAGSKWAYTFENPGDGWAGRCPLPRSLTAFAPFSTENIWLADKNGLWMTRIVVMPADYVPGKLAVQYMVDDEFSLYINGVPVMENVRGDSWRTDLDVSNALRPGRNILAVHAVNGGGSAMLDMDIFVYDSTCTFQKTINH